MNLSEIGLDVSFQKDDIYRRSRRLICFDMDSTLIETEVIDELAERAGVGDKVREITASAMRGEIDFRESFSQRVALLKGTGRLGHGRRSPAASPITGGLERMMTILKRVGYKRRSSPADSPISATISGRNTASTMSTPTNWRSRTDASRDAMSARWSTDAAKAELLRLLCQFEEINIAQSVAVGDAPTTCRCSTSRGLGIAFTPNRSKGHARQSISTIGLDGILYFLGLKDSRIEQ